MTFLHKEVIGKKRDNILKAKDIKKKLEEEQVKLAKEYKATKASIYTIVEKAKAKLKAMQTAEQNSNTTENPPAANPLSTSTSNLYFISRGELTEKCLHFSNEFFPREVNDFFEDH